MILHKPDRITIFMLAVLGVLLVLLFSSCSTSKKIKSSSVTTESNKSIEAIDSQATKKTDRTFVQKDYTVTTVETDSGYEKITVTEYDTARASDYFQPIKTITVKEKGTKKTKATTAKNTYDSTHEKSEYVVIKTTKKDLTIIRKVTLKNKEVKRTSYWAYLWFLLIPAAWLIGWWFGLWPLIPKKKKQTK